MARLVVVRSYPKGRRVWVCGQRVHHGVSGIVLAALLARKRRSLAALALAWAATDWHDRRAWFARERVPAVSAQTLTASYPISSVCSTIPNQGGSTA